jgi:hypothetical protein
MIPKKTSSTLNPVNPGTDVMILKIFLPKNITKVLAFFAQATASFCKI